MTYLKHTIPAEDWAWQNFHPSDLPDGRLERRAIKLATAMAAESNGDLPSQQQSWKDIKGAYRFFSNPRVTPDNLQSGHRDLVFQALSQSGTYLLIEDTSEFSWSGKDPIEGLGPVGSGQGKAQGFHLHSVLAVIWPDAWTPTPSERRPPVKVLGVPHQEFYIRIPASKERKKRSSYYSAVGPRESLLWPRSTHHLGPAPKGVKWIRVCDRGADIYELLASCQEAGHDYVVRAAKDRGILDPETDEKTEENLFATARGGERLGTMRLDLRSRKKIAARKAELAISCRSIRIRSPMRKGHRLGGLPPIDCSVIWVHEINPPKGTKPLEWFLLCGSEVSDFTEALTRVLQYACRWLIEEYHKAIKTGLGAEKLQMNHARHLFAAVSMMAIVALRLIDLREALRFCADEDRSQTGLTPLDFQILEAKTGLTCRSVRDVGMAIGRLGGHPGRRRDGMPGWITLYRGMNKLTLMVQGALMVIEGLDDAKPNDSKFTMVERLSP